jgi:hypothetical protein
MAVSAYKGVVENGQIKLPPGVQLPEQSTVYVVVADAAPVVPVTRISSPRLARPDQSADFVKEVVEEG